MPIPSREIMTALRHRDRKTAVASTFVLVLIEIVREILTGIKKLLVQLCRIPIYILYNQHDCLLLIQRIHLL